jgi:hypothetical protein
MNASARIAAKRQVATAARQHLDAEIRLTGAALRPQIG